MTLYAKLKATRDTLRHRFLCHGMPPCANRQAEDPATKCMRTLTLPEEPSPNHARQQQVEDNPHVRSAIGPAPRFKPNWLQWPVERSTRNFRVYVVEPREYSPKTHTEIFNAALNSLVIPESSRVDPYFTELTIKAAEHFDLITFPEAFLLKDDLLSILAWITELERLGCVHVGLRLSNEQHLFKVGEIRDLVDSLLRIPKIDKTDLTMFSEWLAMQSDSCQFNIGCLFTIDAKQSVRICLHPKLVRSQYETSPLHENHMTEADLLTIVTLQPEDKIFLTITLQPLICSDVLFLGSDRPNSMPLHAINACADCFDKTPPDHIDIVSVTTCTPQPEKEGGIQRRWHQQFRNSFVRAASDPELTRHHFSTFVLSNFGMLPKDIPGGLSGAFTPTPLRNNNFPKYLKIWAWGRPKEEPESDNSWFQLDGDAHASEKWSSLGYIAAFDDFGRGKQIASMLGFTIHRLVRDTPRWGSESCFVDFKLKIATHDSEFGRLVFRKDV